MVEIEKKSKAKEEGEIKVQREVIGEELGWERRGGEEVGEEIKLEAPSFFFEGVKVETRKPEEGIKAPEIERIQLEVPSYQEAMKAELKAKPFVFEFLLPSFSSISLSFPSFSFFYPQPFHIRKFHEEIIPPPPQKVVLREPLFGFCSIQKLLEPELSPKVPKVTESPITQIKTREEKMQMKTLPKAAEALEEESTIDLLLEEFPFRLEIGDGGEALENGAIVIAPRMEDGFEALRKIFILELIDRGKDPSPIILQKEEIAGKNKEGLLCLMRGHRLISIEGYGKPGELEEEIKEAIKVEVEREELKYILLKFPEALSSSLDDYRRFFGTGRITRVELNRKDKEKFSQEIASVFNALFEHSKAKNYSLDELCSLIEGRKDVALNSALNLLLKEPEILALEQWQRVPGESDEHYAMKLLVAKKLMEKGEKVKLESPEGEEKWWEVVKENGKEILSVEKPKKRVDISTGRIWVECETLKNLNNPLVELRKKSEKILSVIQNQSQSPKEIWFVFPYRKAFIYRRRLFEPLRFLPTRRKILFADFSKQELR